MTFKPFFIHFNRPVSKSDNSKLRHSPRGFTAYIQPSALERTVQVQMTFCSAADEFRKKEGRDKAQQAVIEAVNPRDVPELLAKAAEACGDWPFRNQYLYVLKYMI